MIALFLLGCAAPGDTGDTAPSPPRVGVQVDGGRVLDPKLQDNEPIFLVARVSGGEGVCAGQLLFRTGDGLEGALGERVVMEPGVDAGWSFDGTLDDGLYADPGPVWLTVRVECGNGTAEAELELYVVRLGIARIDFLGGAPLGWHRAGLGSPAYTAIGEVPEYFAGPADAWAASAVDDVDGAALPPVPPWEDPDLAPWDAPPDAFGRHNVPVALAPGAATDVRVTLADTAVSARTGAPVPALGGADWADVAPELQLYAAGFSADDNAAPPGGVVELGSADWAPEALGRHDQRITWSWQASFDHDGWLPVRGGLQTGHTVYGVIGPSRVPDGTAIDASPAMAWIAALEDVDEAISGLPPDEFAVMDALRDALHDDPYLYYDPNDAAYTSYEGDYITWDYIWIELGDWLDRRDGLRLYCHSMACLLSAEAQHVGVDADYMTIGVGFTTNYVRAAGSEDWRTWGFNSHGITTADGGSTVWDAAIDLDGDGDPTTQPNTAYAPKGLSFAEYLDLFSEDGDIAQVNGGKCFVY